MIPTVKDVLTIIDEIAPFDLAEKWDNPGLQAGSQGHEVKKILVALDPTVESVNKAAASGAQLLLTHHPLLFRPVSIVDYNRYPGDVIHEAVKKGVAVIAAHTNLDSAKKGINYTLAEKLGLKNVEVLAPAESTQEDGCGLGVVGNLDASVGLISALEIIKKALGIEYVKVVKANDSQISRIAVVGGAGRDFIDTAVKKNADLFLTGDIGHHDALTAKSLNINVVDAGHFSTEKAALTGFTASLAESFDRHGMEIILELYEEETDPVRIL